MSVDITFLGHAGFMLKSTTHTLLIDPFLTGNELAKHKPDDIECDAIALTHGHEDHVGDTVRIAKKNGATVYCAFELGEILMKEGVKNVEQGNPGGRIKTDFGFIAFTQAFHSSSYDGKYAGQPCGLIVDLGGARFYHTGDTALFSDMKLIGEIYQPDVAMIPIGDRFTMGPELATMAAEFINPRFAIPIHYNTWPPIAQDPAKLRPHSVEVKVMQAGDAWTLRQMRSRQTTLA